ncbi:unnamed protein product [marine sediment metagenome]|uniref:Phage shock protein PspC N-terminal domain-containing protein n=1 Tax=marine sediment metagenome TaxID=412755 RepID=X1HMV5_9ZZZZ
MDKRLYRSRKDRKLCGVCGGIAEYLNADPTIVRLLWTALTIFSEFFLGIILYLACCLIIPEEK